MKHIQYTQIDKEKGKYISNTDITQHPPPSIITIIIFNAIFEFKYFTYQVILTKILQK